MLHDPTYSNREPKIEILRFLLACFVLFVHIIPWYHFAGLPVNEVLVWVNIQFIRIFQGGAETNPAVLGFIVLSGYCIHRNGIRGGFQNISHFLRRRIFRILPMFCLGSAMGMCVFFFVGDSLQIQAITGTQNLTVWGAVTKLFALHSFAPFFFQSAYQGNGPLITAGVEFWLYLAYPLMLFVLNRYPPRMVWLCIVIITIHGALLCNISPSLSAWWHNGSLLGFLIYWYIGALAVKKEFEAEEYWHYFLFLWVGLSLFLMFVMSVTLVTELRKVVFAVLCAILLRKIDSTRTIISSIQEKTSSTFQIFSAGYSLYAVHVPIITLCIYYKISIWLSVGFVFLTTYAAYFLVEKPLTKLGRNFKEPLRG